jgi:type I restriction enzyme S subunit
MPLLEESEKFIRQTLRKLLPNGSRIFLFGSRARGDASHSSDFDICIMSDEPIDSNLFAQIRAVFEESFVPFNVDLVDYSQTTEEFRSIAMKDAIEWS